MRVVLATTTSYKGTDTLRYSIALRMIQKANMSDYPLIVVDSSPSPDVALSFRASGAIVYPQQKEGMGESRREVFAHALAYCKSQAISAILWLEPEKDDLIRFVDEIAAPVVEGRADIAIPQRTEKSWNTYPVFQAETEREGNKEIARFTGREDLDLFFGPVCYSSQAAKLVAHCDPEALGIPDTYLPQYLPTLALRKGMKVVSVSVNFTYPPEQKREEDADLHNEIKEKRMAQLHMGIQAHRTLASLSQAML